MTTACFRREANTNISQPDSQYTASNTPSMPGEQEEYIINDLNSGIFETSHDTNSIAIVNLDDGVEINGQLQVYSDQIIQLPSNDAYTFTSLSDAQSGIESGRYGAYIIIPATFSSSIESINSSPIPCNLEYVVDEASDIKADLVRDIYEFYLDINNRISYMYMANILASFHEAQDNAATVLSNDNYDYDVMTQIQPADLMASITLTETALPANTTEPLNIDNYSQAMAGTIASINNTYSEYATSINDNITNINNEIDSVFNSINTASEELNAQQNSIDEVTSLDLIVDSQRIELLGLFQAHNNEEYNSVEILDNLQQQFDILNQALVPSLVHYRNGLLYSFPLVESFEYTENIHDSSTEIQIISDGNVVQTINLNNYIDSNVNSNGDEAVVITISQLENLINGVQTYNYNRYSNYLNSQASMGINLSELELFDSNNNRVTYESVNGNERVYTFSDIIRNVSTSMDELSSGTLESTINSLYSDYSNHVQSIIDQANDEIRTANSRFNNVVEGITGTITTVTTTINESNRVIEENRVVFDPSSANSSLSSLQGYAYSIQQAAYSNNSEYLNYTQSVLVAETDNMNTLRQNIFSAQTLSNQTVADGLEEAIAVRIRTSNENRNLMNGFINMLPYTRLGTLENTTTYQFIANPITLTEASGS